MRTSDDAATGGAFATRHDDARRPRSGRSPIALIASRRRQPGSARSRSQCRIMPAWLIVKSMNTPTAYSGISRWVSPLKIDDEQARRRRRGRRSPSEREPVAAERELAGHEAVARRGSRASRGKALKLVFAARNRSRAVNAWNRKNGIDAVAVDRAGDLEMTVCVSGRSIVGDPEVHGEERDPDEQDRRGGRP